jgi:hypothetical protein
VHSSDAVKKSAVGTRALNPGASQILRRNPAFWEALARILFGNFASVSTAAYRYVTVIAGIALVFPQWFDTSGF